MGDALKLALTSPPVEGRANQACIEFLANCCGSALVDSNCRGRNQSQQGDPRLGAERPDGWQAVAGREPSWRQGRGRSAGVTALLRKRRSAVQYNSGMDLPAIQAALREQEIDAWLFYDHHRRDPIAYNVLGLSPELHVSRRWYYLIPAQGEPAKLNHRVEPRHLQSLPGGQRHYGAWQEMWEQLREMLRPYKRVAMQYSPMNQIMYVSLVDGGTLELVRGFGVEVVSSADLVARFEATLSAEQIATHFEARDAMDAIMEDCFQWVGQQLRNGGTDEFAVQQRLAEAFRREQLVTDDLPIVAVNENSGNPHYLPTGDSSKPINKGDFLLIDMWAKKDKPGAVYYDITWTGFAGAAPSGRLQEIFGIVRDARDVGIRTVQQSCGEEKNLRLGGGRRGSRVHCQSRLRRVLCASHRALDRHRGARQWREHGQPGNARRTRDDRQYPVFDRAGNLPAGVWRAQRN